MEESSRVSSPTMDGSSQDMSSNIICILGMHRSGTSLTARLLNLLGVYLGPEEHLVKATWPNPKGFWEHRPIVNVNNQILWKLGGHSHDPPIFTPGWEDGAEFDDVKERAIGILRDDFAGADLWGWKDPRTCLTLPFWQRLLPPIQYVICMRHPVAVAQSLTYRDGLSLEGSINLWLVYLRSALSHSSGHERILVFYDDILEDWQSELRRLAQFVGRRDRAEHADVRQAVEDFIDLNLRHHHSSPPENEAGGSLDFPGAGSFGAGAVSNPRTGARVASAG